MSYHSTQKKENIKEPIAKKLIQKVDKPKKSNQDIINKLGNHEEEKGNDLNILGKKMKNSLNIQGPMSEKMEVIKTQSTSFTFQVEDVQMCTTPPTGMSSAEDIVRYVVSGKEKRYPLGRKVYTKSTEKFEDFSHKNNTNREFLLGDLHGVVGAIHTAYMGHYPLKLSVSDFIILLGQGLGKHIEKNAEELRKYFVDHEGKEKIIVRRDDFMLGAQNDWSTIFGDFTDEIKSRVKTDIYDVIIDDTSVATRVSRIVSEITLMDAMKQYFDYALVGGCGIPKITLEGLPEDWEKLRQKVRKLIEMNKNDCLKLNWWLKHLVPVIEKVCDTGVTRKADPEFWSTIYQYHPGQLYGPSTFVSGWIRFFFPYLVSKASNFSNEISPNEIPKQISTVPFSFIFGGTDVNIPMNFCGGYMGAHYNKEEHLVEPAQFWCVMHKSQ